jgi:glycosyltransferase involved in cell wall biosynthesis
MTPVGVKLALSTLCENPFKRTGLSTLFHEFIRNARTAFPGVTWVVFVGRNSNWPSDDPGVEVCRKFPSNEHLVRRIMADQFSVAAEARRRGAAALFTVGFTPLLSSELPVAMQVVALESGTGSGGLRGLYRKWAISHGLGNAAIVIANSAWTATQLGRARGRVVVSPEGLDHRVFEGAGPDGKSVVPGRYLLWASNLYAYKRIELAFAAYATWSPSERAACPFVVAGGSWGEGRRKAELEANRLGISSDVRFLGWVSDEELPKLYKNARAHVLSTSAETFGRSVLEAMACGCPSIVQDLPVLREVAAECAMYVDFRDAAAAGTALRQLCDDEELHSRLRIAGIERSRLFSFERLARERVGCVLQLLGAT